MKNTEFQKLMINQLDALSKKVAEISAVIDKMRDAPTLSRSGSDVVSRSGSNVVSRPGSASSANSSNSSTGSTSSRWAFATAPNTIRHESNGLAMSLTIGDSVHLP